MRITVEHTTRYRFARETTYSVHSLRLTPAAFRGQTVVSWSVAIAPGGEMLAASDGFGNAVHLASIVGAHAEVAITAAGVVDVEDRHGVVDGAPERVGARVFLRRTPLTDTTTAIEAVAADVAGGDRIGRLHALMGRIRDRVDYVPGATAASTAAGEALAAGKGVCQDHAHIFIAAARHAGVPARYVTGYLLLGSEAEAPAHHAWAEAWVEGLGWVAFDVANRVCPTDRYVRLAVGLDAASAAPIRGTRRGGSDEETLDVAVRVAQIMAQQGQQ